MRVVIRSARSRRNLQAGVAMRPEMWTHVDNSLFDHIYINWSAMIGDHDEAIAMIVRQCGGVVHATAYLGRMHGRERRRMPSLARQWWTS